MNPGLALLTLLACSPGKTGGEAYFDDWACEHEVWDWYADPVQAVLEADDDGEFSYDPPGDVVTDRTGAYDFESGDLSWVSSYVDGYYGVSGEVEGYGTIYADGDLDLLYRSVFTDVLDEVSHTRVRVERSGCSATTKTWDIEAEDDLATTPADEPFEWSLEIVSDTRVERSAAWQDGGEDWTAQGSTTSDLVSELSYGTTDGDVLVETVDYPDGTGTTYQEVHETDYDAFYTADEYLDGGRSIFSEAYDLSGDKTQECAYDLSYAGVGAGECTFWTSQGVLSCDIAIDGEDCELDCGANGTYDC